MKSSQHNDPDGFFACHQLPRKMISQYCCSTCLHRIQWTLLHLQSTLDYRLTSIPIRQKILPGTMNRPDLRFDRNHYQSLVQPIFIQHKYMTMCHFMQVYCMSLIEQCNDTSITLFYHPHSILPIQVGVAVLLAVRKTITSCTSELDKFSESTKMVFFCFSIGFHQHLPTAVVIGAYMIIQKENIIARLVT